MSGNEGIDMQSDFFIRIRQKNPNQSSTGTSYDQNQGKILFKIVHCTLYSIITVQVHPREYQEDTTKILGFVLKHDDSVNDR